MVILILFDIVTVLHHRFWAARRSPEVGVRIQDLRIARRSHELVLKLNKKSSYRCVDKVAHSGCKYSRDERLCHQKKEVAVDRHHRRVIAHAVRTQVDKAIETALDDALKTLESPIAKDNAPCALQKT